MNIHEHQAKELFDGYDIPVSTGSVAYEKSQINEAVGKVKGPIWVVKAQIHAGGRGKGGGVKVVSSKEEAVNEAEKMFGMNLITPQTGPAGKEVKRIYIENGSDIKKELYLSCLLDRATSKVAFIVSKMGGMDIEAVAKDTPENITTVQIEPSIGVTEKDVNTISKAFELEKDLEGLDFPPIPGELGKKIWENVSKEAWNEWIKHQTMLVNEYRLNLSDIRARKYLAEQMEAHFFGDGADAASGFIPPET